MPAHIRKGKTKCQPVLNQNAKKHHLSPMAFCTHCTKNKKKQVFVQVSKSEGISPKWQASTRVSQTLMTDYKDLWSNQNIYHRYMKIQLLVCTAWKTRLALQTTHQNVRQLCNTVVCVQMLEARQIHIIIRLSLHPRPSIALQL